MFKRLFTASLIFGAAALGPPVAEAQQVSFCAPRDSVVTQLEQRFAERRIAIGLQSPATLMELWGSEETGTFTVLLTSATGQSCVLASGGALMLDLPEQPEVGTRTGY
jgi:hypothetical protein